MIATKSFLPSEIVAAMGLAVIIEGGLFVLFATAANNTHIREQVAVVDEAVPIEVKPVMDDVPLLKLGSKKLRAKLPDMWAKKPPIKRYEAASAPSPKAEPVVEKIPETPLVKKNAEAPPPDASIVKKLDETPKVVDAGAPRKPMQLAEEGSEEGVKEGTEKDPLKAYAVSQYRMKIASWFNARFKRPKDIPCEELKKLRASATASVSGDRIVTGFSIGKPSGNAAFDERVKSTLDGIVGSGAELPPPPPNYAEVLGSSISVGFHVPSCD